MRHKLASLLLMASIFVWGIWCGGQVFNELMTVPIWSASLPESLKTYNALPSTGGINFFMVFGPLLLVVPIAATIVAWKGARKARFWLATTAIIAIGLAVALNFYLVPLVQSMFAHSVAGDLPASEIIAGVNQWKLGNRIRLIIELLGFVFSIIALHVWSIEKASINEGVH
jgi:hypothetical protein